MPTEKDSYTGKEIKVLEGLEGVRRRPAMYIGSTGKEGLHHLVYEVVDNSVDEALAGVCTSIRVVIHKDGSVTVDDNGRGIPVDINKTYKKSALELVMTKLHAGGKFDKKAYMISGGLHGVGVSVVNALSKKVTAEVWRNGKLYRQEYVMGVPKSKVKEVGSAKGKTGTRITFWPNEDIFSTINFDFSTLANRFREIAFLNAGLEISLKDEKQGKKQEFEYKGGLMEFVKWINRNKDVLYKKPVYFKKKTDKTIIEVAIQHNTSYKDNIFGFVNTINTVEGGTHISGFKKALTRAVNDYAKKQNILKKGNLSGDDTREGLTAIVSIKIPEPQFEGQTKTKLGNSEVRGYVDSVSSEALSEFFEENPSIAKKITNRALDASKARQAAKKAKELVRRKSAFGSGTLPGKLADCSKKKSSNTEIYIVEGDSAGGSAKQARNKEIQAILPLRGKILNVEKSASSKVFSNEEISSMITAIGTGVGEGFNIEKIRYNKVIIMTDADVDGQHIKTLLLTFFYRFMPKLIENGHIYVAVSPLYKVRKKKDHYVYTDAGLKKIQKKLKGKLSITRFKGLGEMNPQQLWDTTMNPKTRMLKKVTIEDAIEADETFSVLMGGEVEPRRKFIQEHAKEAELDI